MTLNGVEFLLCPYPVNRKTTRVQSMPTSPVWFFT
jgi:hypothetical protein